MATKKPAATKKTKVQYITVVDDAIDSCNWYLEDSLDKTLSSASMDFDDGEVFFVYKVELIGKYRSRQTFEEVK